MDATRYSCYARIDDIGASNQRTTMVFLLFVVSFLLTVGGGAAALYGADTIRTETGSTLAVAGVAMTCAGLLMVALTACLSELKKIRRQMEAVDVARAAAPPIPVAVTPALVPAGPAAVAAAVVAADRATPEPAAVAARIEPTLEAGTPAPAVAADVVPDEVTSGAEPGPAPAVPVTVAAEPSPDGQEETKTAPGAWDPERPAQVPAGISEAPAEIRDVPDLAAPAPKPVDRPAKTEGDAAPPDELEAAPGTAKTEPAPAQGPAERELVATYTSGDNTYFMYSDNAIEAETPNGRFRFASMEELRAFVETGTGGMPLTPPPPRRD